MIRSEAARKAKMNKILNTVKEGKKAGTPVLKDRIVALFGIDDGVAPRTVKEYIKTLVDAGLIYEEKTPEGVLLKV